MTCDLRYLLDSGSIQHGAEQSPHPSTIYLTLMYKLLSTRQFSEQEQTHFQLKHFVFEVWF